MKRRNLAKICCRGLDNPRQSWYKELVKINLHVLRQILPRVNVETKEFGRNYELGKH